MTNPHHSHTQYVRELADDKTDPALGKKVRNYLIEKGLVKLPLPSPNPQYNPRAAVQQISQGISSGLGFLGLDMEDPSLRETPLRYAKMLVGELTVGLNFDFFPKMTVIPNGDAEGVGRYDQMILEKKIEVMSLCEHHLQTIDGYAHVAYIPDEKVLGLSKMARVTEFFCRRPQIQERLTEQIYHALAFCVGTPDVAVVIEATHYCMKARGALQHTASTITDKLGGRFLTVPSLRQEFFDRVNNGR